MNTHVRRGTGGGEKRGSSQRYIDEFDRKGNGRLCDHSTRKGGKGDYCPNREMRKGGGKEKEPGEFP